jgi:integrase/recombinase XerD
LDDAELRAILAAQARLIAELSERLAPAWPVVSFAELYRQYEIAQKHRPGWVTSRHMLTPLVARIGARDCAGLVVGDWTAYRIDRADLAPSSLNLALGVLKAMLRWGKREGVLGAVPQLCEARRQPQKAHRDTAPTEDEVREIFAEADRDRDRAIVLCACHAGMRNSEIRLLEWSWIDRARLLIHLPASITKSRKARTIPITHDLLKALDQAPRDIRSPLVFRSPRSGRAYSRTWMSQIWRLLLDRTGVKAAPGEKRVHLHDGRAGYASNAAERGVRIEILSKILGHATLAQTQAYIRHRAGDLDAARDAFERGIKRDRR